MRFTFLFLFLLSALLLRAQVSVPADTARPKPTTTAQRPPATARPAIGSVVGIVSDSSSGQGLEYITLTVFQLPDSTVKGGGITTRGGQFTLTQLPAGRFFLRASFIGYTNWYSPPFVITPQAPQADLGRIRLTASARELTTVEVADERSDYSNSIDKKVYDVNQNITNAGGTATDVLQNIPSVAVDIDGKVSLRGSENVTILIDGRPSGITGTDRQAALQQVPASIIDRIEVITNPSARYDAQGMSGIINIITKKDAKQGFNGSATLGQGSNGKYNGAVNINNRMKKVNLFANYNWRNEDRWSAREGEQHTFTSDTNFYFTTNGGGLANNRVHTGRIGADFYLNAYNTLSLNGGINYKRDRNEDSLSYFFLDAQRAVFGGFDRFISERQKTFGTDAALDYKKAFPGSKRTLTGAASLSTNNRTDRNSFRNASTDAYAFQLSNSDNVFYTGIAQLDYTHPLNDSLRLETGVKFSLRDYDNTQTVSLYDGAGNYVSDARFSDRFRFNEYIYAGYVQAAMHRGKFDYQLGVRGEQTQLTGVSAATTGDFKNSYFGLFPSATVRFTPKYGLELQIGYSRRLNRPGNGQLNPYVDISDSINLRSGNPFLQPEYIHAIELNAVRTWEGWSMSGTVYYRHTDDLISMIRLYDLTTGIALVRPINLSTSDNIGIESVIRVQLPKKRGNVMLNLTGFRNVISGENVEAGLQSSALNGTARLTANYKLLPTTNLQLTGFYSSPFVQPLGSFYMIGGIDAGIRQELFKGKAQVTANVSDLFDTKAFRIKNALTGYDFTARRKRESRILMVTFTWRFGQGEEAQQRRNRQPQGVDDGGQMGF